MKNIFKYYLLLATITLVIPQFVVASGEAEEAAQQEAEEAARQAAEEKQKEQEQKQKEQAQQQASQAQQQQESAAGAATPIVTVTTEKIGSVEAQLGKTIDSKDTNIQDNVLYAIDNYSKTLDFSQLTDAHITKLADILSNVPKDRLPFDLTTQQNDFFRLTDNVVSTLNAKAAGPVKDALARIATIFVANITKYIGETAIAPENQTKLGNLISAATANPGKTTLSVIDALIGTINEAYKDIKEPSPIIAPAEPTANPDELIMSLSTIVQNIHENTLAAVSPTLKTSISTAFTNISANENIGWIDRFLRFVGVKSAIKPAFAYDTYVAITDTLTKALALDKTGKNGTLRALAKEINFETTDLKDALNSISVWVTNKLYSDALTKNNNLNWTAKDAMNKFAKLKLDKLSFDVGQASINAFISKPVNNLSDVLAILRLGSTMPDIFPSELTQVLRNEYAGRFKILTTTYYGQTTNISSHNADALALQAKIRDQINTIITTIQNDPGLKSTNPYLTERKPFTTADFVGIERTFIGVQW